MGLRKLSDLAGFHTVPTDFTRPKQEQRGATMKSLLWWMRAVGSLYIFVFLAAAVLRLPIRGEGPEGILAAADAHDPTAIFVLDTWTMFGLMMGAVGVGLLRFSREPDRAGALVWTVLGIELCGIATDIVKLSHGYVLVPPVVWMAIHAVAVVTGYLSLRGAAKGVPRTALMQG
jgi:hypothetical protein